MDKPPGNGEAVPKTLRNFRRETTPDNSSTKGIKRSVSFVKDNSGTNEDDEDRTLQSLETQTDWDWLEDAILDESVKIIEARKKRGSSESLSQSVREGELERLAQSDEEGQLPYPYSNDEYGIPILDLSSDTDDYIRESEQEDLNSMNVELGDLDTSDYPQDEDGNVHGYFSGTCEFCQKTILPFPTTEQQQQQPPEELFCCEEYRKFIELTIEGDTPGPPSKSLIDVRPHPHYGNKQARKIAQLRAHQRMRERELLRLQQNVALQNTSHPSNYQPPRSSKNSGPASQKDGPPKISKALGMRALESSGVERPALNALNFFAPVARQMKTINYQLSSQRCLEEGWTVRPPSPMLVNETDDVFVPEPLDSAFTTTGKMRKRVLIQKHYDSGEPFITIFPDGSGNVFYPSGHVAIVISCKEPGQYTYLVLDDYIEPSSDNPIGIPPQVLAVFQANGQASCTYTTGKLRLFLDQYIGIELDRIGAKKRKWIWKDTDTHVHAPPFQPVCFSLSQYLAVRVMAQENISLTFRCRNRSCRFPVGAKLKLVAPENIPPKEFDQSMMFINETKVITESLLHKISNLLRFPNSPKVDKMLPPLHITSKMHKNQKLREEQDAIVAAAQAKVNKPRPIRPVVVS